MRTPPEPCASRRTSGDFAVLIAVFVSLAFVTPLRAADTQPATRTLTLAVVRSDSNTPLQGARAYYHIDGDRGTPIQFDSKGEGRIPLPERLRQVRLEIAREGFVEYSVAFGEEPRALPLTDRYTAHMLPGVTVGGIVQDENGKGVEGVKVLFTAFYEPPDQPGKMFNGFGVATTDAQGHWTYAGAPPEPKQLLSISAQHPDFILKTSNQNLRLPQYEQLKKKELVSVIRRGLSVPGTVTDREGNPIANAKIGQDSLGLVNGTTSDAQGKFTLRGVEPGARQMMASAPDYVAKEIDYTAEAGDAKPLEFKLEKGRTLKGVVVDAKGRPLSGVSISFIANKQFPRMNDYVTTDSEGRFAWNGAPQTPVTASLYKQGYIRQVNLTWTAGSEPRVEMAEAPNGDPFARPVVLTIRGDVVDDKTGHPVDMFQALVTMRSAARGTLMWTSHATGKAGKYSIGVSEPGDKYVVRIEADGYLPFDSPTLTQAQVARLDVRLKRGEGITGVVLRPDGQPAPGAEVALREWYMLEVDNGQLSSLQNPQQTHATRADAAGRFLLPARKGRVRVFAVHPSGWGEWIVNGEGEAPEPLKTWDWGKVEGTVTEKGKPLVGKTIRIQIYGTGMSQDMRREEYSARTFFRYETTTDQRGHFEFDHVIDGPGEVEVEAAREGQLQRVVNGYTARLEMKPGEHKVTNFGGTGRPVVGKLLLPADLKEKIQMPRFGALSRVAPTFLPPPGYDNLTAEQKQDVLDAFHQTPDYQDYISKPTGYGVTVNPDGSFRAQDVPAGDYRLYFNVLADRPDNNGRIATLASAMATVKVPEIPGDGTDQPLDVGTLDLLTRKEPPNP